MNNSEDDCEEIDDTDQRSQSLIKKDIILPDSASTRISSPIGSGDIFVRKRFQKKASVLLEKLEANPHFKVNDLKEITIDDVHHHNSNLHNLIENCFYPTKYQSVIGLEAFLLFLKENHLYSYVTNPYVQFKSDANLINNWWFLGDD